MKKQIVLFILLGIIFSACVDRTAISVNKMYFKNNTNHIIKFLPYKGGLVIKDSIKIFLPNTNNFFEGLSLRMYSSGYPNPTFRYQENADSILVIFDDIKKEKHTYISISPTVTAPVFLPNKERSLYSREGDIYKQKII